MRSLGPRTHSFTITETEAYEGEHDLACHSAKGRTARTEVMFGPAGRFYIYRIYGLHWMLNIVTGEVNEAAAVLIRGVEGVNGPAAWQLLSASIHQSRDWMQCPPPGCGSKSRKSQGVSV